MIAQMTMVHVDEVISVHLNSFRGFFLSFLGPRFLRLYYESIVEYPAATGYVYVQDGHTVGFVCGTVHPSQFYRFLLRSRWWRFAVASLGAVFRKPSIIPRLARALRYPSQTSRRDDTATLTSMAVEPAFQGQGIGTELARAFLEDMRSRGVKRVDLTTERHENEEANAFYQKQGFRCERSFVTPEGKEMNEYVISL